MSRSLIAAEWTLTALIMADIRHPAPQHPIAAVIGDIGGRMISKSGGHGRYRIKITAMTVHSAATSDLVQRGD